MNGNSKPYAILVFGVPMSGKTQFATKFSRQFRAPFLDFTQLSGVSQTASINFVKQAALSQQNLVIEGPLLDSQQNRTKLRETLLDAGYQPALIWIQTDVKAVKQRLKAKLGSVEAAKTAFDARIKPLEAPAHTENPIVISGKHTFATQRSAALAGLKTQDSPKLP